LVRDVKARQALVRSALEDAEEDEALPFVGSVQPEQGAEALADAMRRTLDFDLAEYRAADTIDEAFRILRDAVERAGVLVILKGNLGHHTSNLSPSVFRGFAIADPVAPFVVINETDSRSAWSFTLLHELAHVFLGESGISGYDSEQRVERLCDEAAACFLLQPYARTNWSRRSGRSRRRARSAPRWSHTICSAPGLFPEPCIGGSPTASMLIGSSILGRLRGAPTTTSCAAIVSVGD
jgi:hypothetical protein